MINILLTAFFILIISVLFVYRIIEKYGSYAQAENFRMFQVTLFTGFFLIHGILTIGLVNMASFLVISIVLSAVLEIIGTNTGWLTGKFKYTDRACPLPSVLGVPLCYPLAWCGLVYTGMWTAICIITVLGSPEFEIGLPVILLTPALVTLLDIILDPIAVHEGRWVWEKPGKFYGVPFSNFRGWFITTLIIILSFSYGLQPELQINELSQWYVFAPVFGYCGLAVAASRVCFERGLKIPGIIAIIAGGMTAILCLLKLF